MELSLFFVFVIAFISADIKSNLIGNKNEKLCNMTTERLLRFGGYKHVYNGTIDASPEIFLTTWINIIITVVDDKVREFFMLNFDICSRKFLFWFLELFQLLISKNENGVLLFLLLFPLTKTTHRKKILFI
jgi:hypothetical protein